VLRDANLHGPDRLAAFLRGEVARSSPVLETMAI